MCSEKLSMKVILWKPSLSESVSIDTVKVLKILMMSNIILALFYVRTHQDLATTSHEVTELLTSSIVLL